VLGCQRPGKQALGREVDGDRVDGRTPHPHAVAHLVDGCACRGAWTDARRAACAGLGLTGEETFTIRGLAGIAPHARIEVEATRADGTTIRFKTLARVDDPTDVEYMRNDGILTMVLRQQLR